MKSNSRIFSFVITTIVFLTGYGFFVFAAPPGAGGYTPGETLDPECTPGQTVPNPCIVKSPLMTGDSGLTVTGSNIQLGGTLLQNSNINLGSFKLGINTPSPTHQFQVTGDFQNEYTDTVTGSVSRIANGIDPYGFGTPGTVLSTTDPVGGTSATILTTNYAPGSFQSRMVVSNPTDGTNSFIGSQITPSEVSTSFSSIAPDFLSQFRTIITPGVSSELSLVSNNISGSDSINSSISAFSGLITDTTPTYLRLTSSINSQNNQIDITPTDFSISQYSNTRDDSGSNTPVNFLYTDNLGKLLSAPISFLGGGGGGSESTTANNGLTLTGVNVQLGGTLVQNTSIAQGGYNLALSGGTFNHERTLGSATSALSNTDNAFGSSLDGASMSYKIGNVAAFSFVGDGTAMGFDPIFQGTGVMDITTGATAAWVAGNNGAIGSGFIPSGETYLHFTAQAGNSISDPDINGFVSTTRGFVVSSTNRSASAPVFQLLDGFSTNLLNVTQSGDVQFGQYPNTRDDSGLTTPLGFLYTDTSGNILSAPLSGILPTGVNGLQNSGQNIALGGALTQNTVITQGTNNFTVLQPVAATGSLVMTQGLATVTGLPGNVMGYIAANGDGARNISWASGAANKLIHTLSGSGDPDLLFGGAEIRTDYDITDTSSAMASLYAFDTPGGKVTRLQLTPTYLNLLLGSTGELRLNNNAGTAGYVIASNGTGVAPTWQDPNLLVSDERLKSNIIDLPTDILSKISQVRTVTYTLNTDQTARTQVGFLAQDLEQYFPELVGQKDATYKGVYYAQMTPVLVEAIRELHLQMTSIDNMAQVNQLRDSITSWLGNQVNGIANIYADIVHSKKVETEQLCIKDVCMDRDQLYSIMQSSPAPVTVITPGPTPTPAPTPDPDPTVIPPSEPDPAPEIPPTPSSETGN